MEKIDVIKFDEQFLCEIAFLLGKKSESEIIKESVRDTSEEVNCFSF